MAETPRWREAAMPYPRRLLTEGERIVREFRPHWRLLVIPVLWSLVGIAAIVLSWVYISESIVNWVITAVAVGAIAWLAVRPFIHWWFTHYILTSERLIKRSGFIARAGSEIPLDRISDVKFAQTVLERLLRSGDVTIESAGEHGQSHFSDIPDPEGFQSLIYRVREERADRKERRVVLASDEAGEDDVDEVADPATRLERLDRLRSQGAITEEEYAAKRADILDEV